MDEWIGPVPEDRTSGQGAREILTTVKFRHLDIGVADRLDSVGVAAGASWNAVLPGEPLCSG